MARFSEDGEIRNHEVIVWLANYLRDSFNDEDGPAQGAKLIPSPDEEFIQIRGPIDLRLLAQDVLAVAVYLNSVSSENLQKLMVHLVTQNEDDAHD